MVSISRLDQLFTTVIAVEEFYAEKAGADGVCVKVETKAAPACPMCAIATQTDLADNDKETVLTCEEEGGFVLPDSSGEFVSPLVCGSGEEASKMDITFEGDTGDETAMVRTTSG